VIVAQKMKVGGRRQIGTLYGAKDTGFPSKTNATELLYPDCKTTSPS
jgi:hypothetical protein